jgi:hypothetical protein
VVVITGRPMRIPTDHVGHQRWRHAMEIDEFRGELITADHRGYDAARAV